MRIVLTLVVAGLRQPAGSPAARPGGGGRRRLADRRTPTSSATAPPTSSSSTTTRPSCRARRRGALERAAGRLLRPAGRAPPQAAADRRHGLHHHRRASAWTSWPTSPGVKARGRRHHRAGHARRDRVRGRAARAGGDAHGPAAGRHAALLRRAGAAQSRRADAGGDHGRRTARAACWSPAASISSPAGWPRRPASTPTGATG